MGLRLGNRKAMHPWKPAVGWLIRAAASGGTEGMLNLADVLSRVPTTNPDNVHSNH